MSQASTNSTGNTPETYNAPPLRASIPPPDLNTWGDALLARIFNQLNCHLLGTVAAFHADTQTADIQPVIQRLVPDYSTNPPQWVAKTMPLLQGVPVFIPSGGGGTLTFPVAPGDAALVLFNDRDMGNWFVSGSANTPPPTQRAHNLSDGLALIGFRNLTTALAGYSTTDAVLQNGGSQISLATQVRIANQATSLYTVLNLASAAMTVMNNLLIDLGAAPPAAAPQIAAFATAINALLKV